LQNIFKSINKTSEVIPKNSSGKGISNLKSNVVKAWWPSLFPLAGYFSADFYFACCLLSSGS